jgi:hypothetical protein
MVSVELENELLRCLRAANAPLAPTARPVVLLGMLGGTKRIRARGEAFGLITDLEELLRDWVAQELTCRDAENWWKALVPPDIRERAEARWQESAGPDGPPPATSGYMKYLDFSDYMPIMLRKDNWKSIFSAVFTSPEWITSRLEELLPIRNNIAHSRTVSDDELLHLRLYASDLRSAIAASRKDRPAG